MQHLLVCPMMNTARSTRSNIGNEVPNILIDGNVVERVDHVKLLGITLSNDLTSKRHVDNIVKKAGKRIYGQGSQKRYNSSLKL